jgi:hypothetical protein
MNRAKNAGAVSVTAKPYGALLKRGFFIAIQRSISTVCKIGSGKKWAIGEALRNRKEC